MNITQVKNFNLIQTFKGEQEERKSQNYATQFGLKMKSPLCRDTVSFKAAAISNKAMGSIKDAVNNDTALKLIKKVSPSHNNFVKLMYETFGDLMSTSEKKGLFSYKERIKTPFSVRQKTTSLLEEIKNNDALCRKFNSMKDIDFFAEEMKDISGNAFILEDAKALQVFTQRFQQLVKGGKVNVVDLEYYRLAPTYKRGKIVESFDSLNSNYVNKLGKTIDEVKNNVKPILDEKPSPAGYSGMHITVKHKDGTYTEIQVMTRAMWNLKEVENFFYKMKEGKTLDPKYSLIEKVLTSLKPISQDAPEKEKKAYKLFKDKIKMYTKEAYKERLKRPYEDRKNFLKPSDIGLGEEFNDFDFNTIDTLRQMCIGKLN